jgi:thiosulfate/3-mercaptopyruvate sulfurtransferase
MTRHAIDPSTDRPTLSGPAPRPLHPPAGRASPLVDAAALRHALRAPRRLPALLLLDASFDLADPAAGEAAYAAGHLPGALYVHLDRDLCAPKRPPGPGFGGRHPLPSRAAFAATAGRWGVMPRSAVVVMDRQGGMYAARLWWMLRWLGHGRVWLLDGGVPAWTAAGGELTTDVPTPRAPPPYPLGAATLPVVSADELAEALAAGAGRVRVVDARAGERFRGEVEPLDSVAGHIPGALNRPFSANLGPDGRFKPPAALREEFAALLGDAPSADVVHQCGSGVTACHNLLAMTAAGLPAGRLYPGSWSEWSADPARPVARG